jgi:hypothetical protein
VAQVVKPDGRAARALQSGPKVASEHILVVVDMISRLIGEYQIQIIFRAGQPPFFQFLNDCGAEINFPLGRMGLGSE